MSGKMVCQLCALWPALLANSVGALDGPAAWLCGSVLQHGTLWDHCGDPICEGMSSMATHHGAGKCWMRKQVDLGQCDIDTDYDYYYVHDKTSKASRTKFEKVPHRNCYPGRGASSMFGHHAFFLNLGACQNECAKEEECEGFVMESQNHIVTSKMETEVESCWLLKGLGNSSKPSLNISLCKTNMAGYDVFLKDQKDLAYFDEEHKETYCEIGAARDKNYGVKPLQYVGTHSPVGHAGDCFAACHTEPRCEGVQVLYPLSQQRLFEAQAVGTGRPPTTTRPLALPLGLLTVVSSGVLAAAALTRLRIRRRQYRTVVEMEELQAAKSLATSADNA